MFAPIFTLLYLLWIYLINMDLPLLEDIPKKNYSFNLVVLNKREFGFSSNRNLLRHILYIIIFFFKEKGGCCQLNPEFLRHKTVAQNGLASLKSIEF